MLDDKPAACGIAKPYAVGLLLPRNRAYVVVAQGTRAHPLDAHNQAAGWVGAGDARVSLHSVGGMVAALFSWQQWDSRL